jgi:hypothetical protein
VPNLREKRCDKEWQKVQWITDNTAINTKINIAAQVAGGGEKESRGERRKGTY